MDATQRRSINTPGRLASIIALGATSMNMNRNGIAPNARRLLDFKPFLGVAGIRFCDKPDAPRVHRESCQIWCTALSARCFTTRRILCWRSLMMASVHTCAYQLKSVDTLWRLMRWRRVPPLGRASSAYSPCRTSKNGPPTVTCSSSVIYGIRSVWAWMEKLSRCSGSHTSIVSMKSTPP